MKKSVIASFLLLLPALYLRAQDFSRDFGVVNQSDIDLTKYSRDPSADAVVLFDIGDSRFIDTYDYSYNIEFTRARRIKILNKAGVKYAEVTIPFYIDEKGNAEVVKTIEAFSYNWENGQLNKTPLNPSTIYVEKITNRWSQKKFVIPDAKQGSIIEYRFVLESPFHFNLPSWRFQDFIPTIYSKYVVRIIPFYEYSFIMHGPNKFDSQTTVKDPKQRIWGTLSQDKGIETGQGVKFNDIIYSYVLKDVPAFKDEEYIASPDDYMTRLEFQESRFVSPAGTKTDIISTWPKLVQELIRYDEFGKFLKACDKPARKILETELDLNGKSEDEICRIIIDYVKKSYGWDERYALYTTKSVREFLNQKKGNPAEINLFLTAMLRAAGVDALPVIISTRDHGKINTNYPFLTFFNYVIVLININDRQYLADGTEYYTSFDRLPSRCINDRGLIIQEGDPKWINLNQNYKSVDNKFVTMDISPENLKVRTKVVLQAVEQDAYWYKRTFRNDSAKLSKQFNDMGLPVITKLSTENFDANDKPYIISAEGEADIEQLNDKLIISPYLSFYMKENRLKQPARTYPVDFTYSNTESFSCRIAIPDGYRVLTIPDPFNTDNDIAKINVSYSVADNKINVESEYSFKKAVNPPSDYGAIRSYFDVIVKKFNEQIVLVKR